MQQIGRFRFENIEHTADKAIRAYGETYPRMLESAAAGMFAQQVDLSSVTPEQAWCVFTEADSAEDLLIAWLRELLLLAEDRGVALCDFHITTFSQWQVEGTVKGARYTEHVQRTGAAVKAVTYHGLAVIHDGEWQGSVTFDV